MFTGAFSFSLIPNNTNFDHLKYGQFGMEMVDMVETPVNI